MAQSPLRTFAMPSITARAGKATIGVVPSQGSDKPSATAFDSFADLCVVESSHAATGQDTLMPLGGWGSRGRSSPAGKAAAAQAVVSKKPSRPSTASGSGIRDALDVCELSFSKNLRDLHVGLLAHMGDCIREVLIPLQDELAATLAAFRSPFDVVNRRIEAIEVPQFDAEPLLELLRDSFRRQEDGKDELSRELHALRDELREARHKDKDALAALGQQVVQMEDRLQASQLRLEETSRQGQDELFRELRSLSEEFREARQREKEAEDAFTRALAGLGQQVGQVEGDLQFRLDKVVNMQEILQRSAERMGSDLGVQTQAMQRSQESAGRLEARLTRYNSEVPVNVDFGQVLGFIGETKNAVCKDMTFLLREIGKIQKVLNVDFMKLDLRSVEIVNGSKYVHEGGSEARLRHLHELDSLRLRDTGVQCCDENLPVHVECQTEEDLLQEKKKDNLKKRQTMRATVRASNLAALHQNMHGSMLGNRLFVDTEKMKAMARLALMRPQYNVHDYYKQYGVIQWVARSSWFETLTMAVIVTNCIWMAVDADYNKAEILYEAEPVFQVMENMFCAYFSWELAVRFLAFEKTKYAFRDLWFVFDTILVLLMAFETWILTIMIMSPLPNFSSSSLKNGTILRAARTVKMLRISRTARLLRAVPELSILIKGIKSAARAVFVFLCMWIILVFIYSLVFRQLSGGDSQLFGTMPDAMNSLLVRGIFAVYEPLINGAAEEHWAFWVLTMSFVVLTMLLLMNMLIGVIIESVNTLSSTEKEGMTTIYLSTRMREIYRDRGMSDASMLSEQDFAEFVAQPEVASVLESVGVDVVMLLDMAPNLFDDFSKAGDTGMSFDKLIETMLNLRGANPAKVKDMKEVLRSLKVTMKQSQSEAAEHMVNLSMELREIREVVMYLQMVADKDLEDEDVADDDLDGEDDADCNSDF